jgi:membrane-bound lytic murein transglycosylase D
VPEDLLDPPPSPPKAHQKGSPTKAPKDRLPEGLVRLPPDERDRAALRERPVDESDPTLSALQKADAALFPRDLPGVEAGFSWDDPVRAPAPRTLLGAPACAQPSAPALSASGEASWLQSLLLPDLSVGFDRRVVTYLKFYRDSARGRTIAAIWARKSGRYIAAIQAELRRSGLPADLAWLSLIESGHNPTIRSPAGAVGLWQFMPEAAKSYGLTVDRWVDERRDPLRSTQAAVRLLKDLYDRFESWELAMAAYNMGHAGLARSMAKFNTNNYWVLSRLEGGIPWETTLYVPKIYALGIVMNNRAAFGLDRIPPDAAQSFETISVEPGVPLESIASSAGMTLDALRELNPMYVADRVPPDGAAHPVRLPVGTAAKARLGLKGRPPERTLRTRLGDSLASLAIQYGTAEAALAELNRLSKGQRLEPGTILLLPEGARLRSEVSAQRTVVVSRVIEPGPGQMVVHYEVQSGDRLDEIAAALGVSLLSLVRDNALDTSAKLREGMTLQAVVSADQPPSGVRLFSGSQVKTVVAGSPEFHAYFEGLRGYRREEVVVRKGDTLASVGSRFGMTVGSMERINRRSRNTPLVEGEVLIVYTDQVVPARNDAESPAPLPEVLPPRPDLLPQSPS